MRLLQRAIVMLVLNVGLCVGTSNSVSFRFSWKSFYHSGRSRKRSNCSCHPSFYFGFGFLEIAPVSGMLVRHFALRLNLKMNLKEVAPVPWMLVLPLFSTSPVMAMWKTNRFQDWWITLERQEVQSYQSCR